MTCTRGHPSTPENTGMGRGPFCRMCKREKQIATTERLRLHKYRTMTKTVRNRTYETIANCIQIRGGDAPWVSMVVEWIMEMRRI